MLRHTREQDKAPDAAAGITAALRRAARRAHEIARDTGTKVVVVLDGETVEMDPKPEIFNDPGYPESRAARADFRPPTLPGPQLGR